MRAFMFMFYVSVDVYLGLMRVVVSELLLCTLSCVRDACLEFDMKSINKVWNGYVRYSGSYD